MEVMNKETQEEIERKREFHRVIDKIRNLQKPNETGQGTSRQKREKHNLTQKYRISKTQKQCHPVQKTQSHYRQ